ncbi:ABC transporter permease [Hymenobacter jejuensis]|nr:ABC transporter permease [Hymenobacter jejuensis]
MQKLAWCWLLFVVIISFATSYLPIPYPPDVSDQQSISVAPSSLVRPGTDAPHWLGTDPLGRDVLSMLLFGARTTLLVSLPAALLATFLGIALGSMSGFWGDHTLKIAAPWWVSSALILPIILIAVGSIPPIGLFYKLLTIITLYTILYFILSRTPLATKRWALPTDSLFLGLVALLSSMPQLILVLALTAVLQPSLGSLLLILIGTSWTAPARLIRAELLRVRALPFMEAGLAAGLPTWRLLWRHALPNAWRPIWVGFPMSVAALVTLEATLSFLGIGLPPEVPSWGRTLATARLDTSAWWLVLFPGAALVLTVLALRQLGMNRAIKSPGLAQGNVTN